MRVCHYEDARAVELEPLTLTRPAFDLLCGQSSLAEKQARHFQASQRAAVVRPFLADLVRQQSPGVAVNDDCGGLDAGPVVIVNGRWLPPTGVAADLSTPCVGLAGDEPAYAVVDAAQFHRADAGRRRGADGEVEGDAALPRGRRPVLPSSVGNRRPQRRPDRRRRRGGRTQKGRRPAGHPARRRSASASASTSITPPGSTHSWSPTRPAARW